MTSSMQEGAAIDVRAERREHPRVEIRWPIKIKTSQGLIEGRLRNLGAGGAYIHCEQTPEPGEHVALTIKPPDQPPLEITAEVVWTGKVFALGMGVNFVDISDADRHLIAEIVSRRFNKMYARS
jgi:hypothetical protein